MADDHSPAAAVGAAAPPVGGAQGKPREVSYNAVTEDARMINYLMVGTNRYEEALRFYDTLLTQMGATQVYVTDRNAGWGWGLGTPMFIVTRPYDGQAATVGNGSMVAFDVASRERVDQLHAQVLALGGSSDGDPGPRGESLYAGYWRDLDGNKFNFICYAAPPASV